MRTVQEKGISLLHWFKKYNEGEILLKLMFYGSVSSCQHCFWCFFLDSWNSQVGCKLFYMGMQQPVFYEN